MAAVVRKTRVSCLNGHPHVMRWVPIPLAPRTPVLLSACSSGAEGGVIKAGRALFASAVEALKIRRGYSFPFDGRPVPWLAKTL